jgi:hypothetical protein
MTHEQFNAAKGIIYQIEMHKGALEMLRLDWKQGFGVPRIIRMVNDFTFETDIDDSLPPSDNYKRNEADLMAHLKTLQTKFSQL